MISWHSFQPKLYSVTQLFTRQYLDKIFESLFLETPGNNFGNILLLEFWLFLSTAFSLIVKKKYFPDWTTFFKFLTLAVSDTLSRSSIC